jgi:hypothetical protein
MRSDAGRSVECQGLADQVVRGRDRLHLFDLETAFVFLWAIGAQPLTGWLLFTFGFFVLLLVLMLLYVWKSRILEEVTE